MDTFPNKHPDAKRPYSVDWTKDLEAAEEIVTSTWEIVGDDDLLVQTADSISADGKITTVRLEAGTADLQYCLINRVITDSIPARHLVATKLLNIRDKTS